MRIKMPATKEEARQFKPLDPGVYTVRIKDVKSKISQTGNPGLNWTLQVTDPTTAVGRLCWLSTPLTENALGFLADLADAIGESWDKTFEVDPEDDGDPGRFAEWIGNTLDVLIDTPVSQTGKPYNSVKVLKR